MAKAKKAAFVPKRFDGEALVLGVGIGGVMAALGVFILWALDTAPEGAAPTSSSLGAMGRLARQLPQAAQEGIAGVLAAGFVLFGMLLVVMGLWWSVRGFFRRG